MKNTIKLTLLILLQMFNNANAQHLEPVRSIFFENDELIDYDLKVKRMLFKNLSEFPEISLVIYPSFRPNLVFQIEEVKKKDTKKISFIAKVNELGGEVWRKEKYDTIPVNEYESKIDSADVEILSDIFEDLLERTHYPLNFGIGFDGTYYTFYRRGQSGKIWSPQDSVNKTIVTILERLINDVKFKNKIALKDYEKAFLQNLIKEWRKIPSIESYKLLNKIKSILEENREPYLNDCQSFKNLNCIEFKENFNRDLIQFEKEIMILFAHGELNYSNIDDIINEHWTSFFHILSFSQISLDLPNVKNKVDYGEIENFNYEVVRKVEHNIFLKIESDLINYRNESTLNKK